MQAHHGLSDFRLMPVHTKSSWVAHAGIFLALANATIAPGAFAWHVKALISTSSPWVSSLDQWGLEVLQLTWFFSSLYLLSLYITLFLRPLRGASTSVLGGLPTNEKRFHL